MEEIPVYFRAYDFNQLFVSLEFHLVYGGYRLYVFNGLDIVGAIICAPSLQ